MNTLPTLFRTEHIRAIEQRHGAQDLMEQAGQAVAELACKLVDENCPHILILAGSGNNGGDALVAARHLLARFYNVQVLFTGDATKLPPDARAAYDAWLDYGGSVMPCPLPDGEWIGKFRLVIDGLLGIGLTRPLDVPTIALITAINALPATRLAIDVPSGLCANTGRVLGAAIQADHTLTFIARKPGLFTLNGADCAGQVHLADLGVAPATEVPCGRLVNAMPCTLPTRKRNSHKGSFGNVAVIGGADSMVGAALLASRAALLSGSGRVYCHLLATDTPQVDFTFPELMLRSGEACPDNMHCLIVGPGMSRSAQAASQLRAALQTASPLVLDADALHVLAADPELRTALQQRGNAMLTPHPGEAAALLGCDTSAIQADRIASALNIAEAYNAIVVLKGAGSIIATPAGNWFVNASGNPGLSAAGMGDVLAGIIAALVAQGLTNEEATLLGVYLHGKAADELVAAGIGAVGLTASEIALRVRDLINYER